MLTGSSSVAAVMHRAARCCDGEGRAAAALAAVLSMWNLCSPGAAARAPRRWRYPLMQKCSKLAAGCVTGSKELRFASNQAAPQAASVAKILAAKRVHQGKRGPLRHRRCLKKHTHYPALTSSQPLLPAAGTAKSAATLRAVSLAKSSTKCSQASNSLRRA